MKHLYQKSKRKHLAASQITLCIAYDALSIGVRKKHEKLPATPAKVGDGSLPSIVSPEFACLSKTASCISSFSKYSGRRRANVRY